MTTSHDRNHSPIASVPGRVAIVGAGLAGMSAAMELVKHGWQVELFEAKRRPGGRTGSFTDTQSEQEIDYCQHVAMGCCENFIDLIRAAHIEHHFQRTRSLTFIEPPPHREPDDLAHLRPTTSVLRSCDWLPPPLHLAPTFARLKYLTWRQKWRLARGLLALKNHCDDPVTDATNMGLWLQQHHQDETLIHKFWNVVLASALGEDARQVAFGPARKVFMDGFLAGHHASDLLIPQRPLSELFGTLLPDHLRDQGVTIHAGARISQVELNSSSHFVLKSTSSSHTENCGTFQNLILAVPWHALARLLSNDQLRSVIPNLDAIAAFPTAPISGVHLWLDRPLTQLPHAVIVDRLSQWLFCPDHVHHMAREEQTGSSRNAEFYHQVVISAAYDVRKRTADDVLAEVTSDLRAAFPAQKEFRLLRGRVVTDPAAVFSITPEVERQRPHTATSQPGLFVAGDFVQTGWPATMESAVISGKQAATAVIFGNAGHRQTPLVTEIRNPPQKISNATQGITRHL